MMEPDKITDNKLEVKRLADEGEALLEAGFRGSKAEAMLAFEYDRIPNFLKAPRAISAQRKVATALLFVIPAMLVVIAIAGGINAYRDRQRDVEAQREWSQLGDAVRRDVQRELAH